MKITKCYLYISVFDVGSVELCEKSYLAGIQEAAWRARTIPQHRISIEAYEDSEDARELGAAARRLDFLRTLMLAAGIRGERLETQAHMVASGSEVPGDFARHAEIRLYPRVPSLCPAVGDALLNYREVSWLQTARQAALEFDLKGMVVGGCRIVRNGHRLKSCVGVKELSCAKQVTPDRGDISH